MKNFLRNFFCIFITLFALQGAAAVSTEEIDITGYDLALTPWSHGRLVELATYTSGSPLRYPSYQQGMQFMLFFDENANTGLYVQTQDPAASVTDWEIVNVGASKKLRIHFYKSPQPTVVQTTITIDPGRPWIAAAEKYKTWAFQQFWAKRKISPFDSVKIIALGASNYFEWMLNPSTGDMSLFLDKFDNNGSPAESPATAIWLTQWRSDPFNVNFPRYTAAPPSNGKSFASVLEDLRARGSVPLPYVNAQLWDEDMISPDEFPAHDYSEDHLVKDALGGLISFSDVLADLKFVCPTVQVWQDIILHARDSKMNDANGVKSQGVYYDMVASAPPEFCFNSTHAHSGGDPEMWVEKYREMLEDTEGVVMVEGSAEVYIDLADVFLMHEDTKTVGATTGIRAVPLWNAVYGTISRTAGWQVNALEEDEGNIIAALKTARAFGSRTWGSPWLEKDSGNPLDFQRRLRDEDYGTVMGMISADPEVLEDGSTLDTGRWQPTGNVANVYDADYGRNVIQLTGTGIAHTAPEWNHAGFTHARWSVQRSNPDDMISGFKVTTVSGKTVFLYYNDSPATTPPSMTHSTHYYVYHGIGIAPAANGWQIIDRDLEADLRNVLPLETIAQVKSFLIFNNPGRVADVKLFPRRP